VKFIPAPLAVACAALALALAAAFGCTVKKERAPGPLVVWLQKQPGEADAMGILAEEFRRETDIELELVFKEPYEIRSILLNNPKDLEGKVDVIEVELFEREAAAPYVQDLAVLLRQIEGGGAFSNAAMQAGVIDGAQKFLPWRLSWPMMVTSSSISAPGTWRELAKTAQDNADEVLIPGLNDDEFFALLCSMVWSFGGDPAKPYDDGIIETLLWLSDLSGQIRAESGAIGAAEIADFASAGRPLVFFEWPQGLLPFILDGSLNSNLTAQPIPCGFRNNCPTFFFGRYLALPARAPHLEDAYRFMLFMVSPRVQNRMIFASSWLPMRKDGWGDLGARDQAYRAFSLRFDDLRPPPPNLRKVEKALNRAGRMVLFEHETTSDAITQYRKIMEEK
jgi:hypothetical protein